MTKQFSLLQLFSIIDGRLSTNIDDVYSIISHVCDSKVFRNQLPVVSSYIVEKNPSWYNAVKRKFLILGVSQKTHFDDCCFILQQNDEMIDIPQLKDEFDTSDFHEYMINNSL